MQKSYVVMALGVGLLMASGFAMAPPDQQSGMQLGNFSVSLTVRDLEKSRAFYEKLGFSIVGGSSAQNYLVLQNGSTTIGLFHGMFDRNILTFNPGWTKDKEVLEDFEDVRALQARLKAANVTLVTETDPDGTGPASIYLVDPDGNPILIDQHVPRPGE